MTVQTTVGLTNENDNSVANTNEKVVGLGGDDVLYAEGNNSTVIGGKGDDVLYVNGDNALAKGGVGNDTIYVNAITGKEQTAKGGEGDDYIEVYVVDTGSVVNVSGGSGADTFLIRDGNFASYPDDSNIITITDFEVGVDTLLFDDWVVNEQVEITYDFAGNAIFGVGDSLVKLKGVTVEDVEAYGLDNLFI